MKKKLILLLAAGSLAITLLGGCGNDAPVESGNAQPVETEESTTVEQEISEEASSEEQESETASDAQASAENENLSSLEDGIYLADFDTDSSMFRINETKDGKGILTVENGKMTIHVTLLSKKILNLYAGLAEDASKEGAELLQPTTDVVTYSDGLSDEVYGFDIPVPYLDEEFDVALVGTKGTWYDHKVSVSHAEKYTGETNEEDKQDEKEVKEGEILAAVTLQGGTGKATIESPVVITYIDGQAYARLVWTSKNYDYMIVNGEKYLNEAETGNPSVFTVPVTLGEEMSVIGDTIAMSTPHEIEYTLFLELEE